MNDEEKKIIDTLESMSPDQARKDLALGKFGPRGSRNYSFASSLIVAKEAGLRDAREAESLSISRKALRISIWATIIATIAMILSAIAIVTKCGMSH